MPRRAVCAGRSAVMSSPLKGIVPADGLWNFVSRLKTVVLPAPLGPISAWIEPRRTRRSTLRTAMKPLKAFVRPRVSRMKSSAMRGFLKSLRKRDPAGAARNGPWVTGLQRRGQQRVGQVLVAHRPQEALDRRGADGAASPVGRGREWAAVDHRVAHLDAGRGSIEQHAPHLAL